MARCHTSHQHALLPKKAQEYAIARKALKARRRAAADTEPIHFAGVNYERAVVPCRGADLGHHLDCHYPAAGRPGGHSRFHQLPFCGFRSSDARHSFIGTTSAPYRPARPSVLRPARLLRFRF
ncbi:hypothetical protein D3C71_1629360 [compost metagenome]